MPRAERSSTIQTVAPCKRRWWRPARSGSARAALAALALATSLSSLATASPAPQNAADVSDCANPVDLRIRVADGPGIDAATCGAGGAIPNPLPPLARMTIDGKGGMLDVHFVLQRDGHDVAYDATGLSPDAEVIVHPSQRGEPDARIKSVRVHGDFVRIEALNQTCTDVAAAIAAAKGLTIDHVERFGRARVTFLFPRISLRSVLELLDEVAETDTREVAERHFEVRASTASPEVRKLLGAPYIDDPKIRGALLERIVALGGDPQAPEDVRLFQLNALDALGEVALAREDPASAKKYYARSLAGRELRDQGRYGIAYVHTLDGLAKAQVRTDHYAEGIATWERAQKAAILVDGDRSEELPTLLAGMADAYRALGDDARYEATLQQAIDVAMGPRRLPVLTTMAMRRLQQGRADDADDLLRDAYAYLSAGPNVEIDRKTRQDFEDAHDAARDRFRKLKRYDVEERYLRRKIDMDVRTWGKDDPLTADAVYFLAMNLVRQDRLHDAEQAFVRYVDMDRKNPGLGIFRTASSEFVEILRVRSKDFAGAATYWEDLVASRRRLFGERDPTVILALRELAILDVVANRDAAAGEAARRSEAYEHAAHPRAPEARLAEQADGARKEGPVELMPELARNAIATLLPPGAEPIAEPQRARGKMLASAIEGYADARERVSSNSSVAIATYETAVALRERVSGLRDATLARSARRLLALYEKAGETQKAELLRTRYALN